MQFFKRSAIGAEQVSFTRPLIANGNLLSYVPTCTLVCVLPTFTIRPTYTLYINYLLIIKSNCSKIKSTLTKLQFVGKFRK